MPSRIGKQSIIIPEEVNVVQEENLIRVTGPKGNITLPVFPMIKLIQKKAESEGKEKNILICEIEGPDNAQSRAFQGLTRSLLNNAVLGVNQLWTKQLEVVGVGFKVIQNGNDIDLSLGFSHPIKVKGTEDVSLTVKNNQITVTGIDKQKVGQIASFIRSLKKPEPYKGKGIRYTGEQVRRKAGKAAKAVGAK